MRDTVVIVEDNAAFRAHVRVLLTFEGYEVIGEAADGACGLDVVRRLRPSVALLDVQLPDTDGFSVARAVCSDTEQTAVATHSAGIVKSGQRAPHAPDGPPGSGPIVTFSRSSLAVPWDERYPSLLDFAEACDVSVDFACRNGTCQNCESGLLAGEVTYHIEPLEPPPDGRVLVCSSRPSSELTLDL